uniref:Uncharacterized protein n=1 Tax=Anguilla anguilla TaxID=7936 RepID=A0A0E9RPS1_ANGAN
MILASQTMCLYGFLKQYIFQSACLLRISFYKLRKNAFKSL